MNYAIYLQLAYHLYLYQRKFTVKTYLTILVLYKIECNLDIIDRIIFEIMKHKQ